jgi:hypothetical protein
MQSHSAPPKFLEDILKVARRAKGSKPPLKAIFDLDSTLFNVSPRITKIFHLFAEQDEIKKHFPEASKELLLLTPHDSDYGVRKTLTRIKFRSPGDDFIMELVEFWKKHFFSSEFLDIDVPYPGAKDFVQSLHDAGADILYLTGRDIPRMLEGTLKSLKKNGFPLNKDHGNVFLKPSIEVGDGEFKRDFFLKLNRDPGEVWFFENEPKNIDLVLTHCPHIKVVFVATVHSEKYPEPGLHIPRISGFI